MKRTKTKAGKRTSRGSRDLAIEPKKAEEALKKAAAIAPPTAGATGNPASRFIDERIRNLGGWRGETLARMRALILEADPEMTEEWKWMNPVWSHHGIVCTGRRTRRS